MDPLEARSLIPLSEHYIHMNHAGVSPLSERSRAAIEQAVEASMHRPHRPGGAFEEADRVRGLAGQLGNASPDSIALTPNTAPCGSLLPPGPGWKAGANVVGARWGDPAEGYPRMSP